LKSSDRYDSLFKFYAGQTQLDWLGVKAQAQAESNFDPDAVSGAGCAGLMQFAPATFAEWANNLKLKNRDAFNPEHSIACACAYMRWLLGRFEGNMSKALAAYNWGIGNLQKCIGAHGDKWQEHLPRETREYIVRIDKNFQRYLREDHD
jgi:soluble lytic murein transglycosylase-like protein